MQEFYDPAKTEENKIGSDMPSHHDSPQDLRASRLY